MKNHKIIQIGLLFSLIFTSCVSELKFKGEITEEKMVMMGLLNPDSLVKINLTQTIFFLDYDMDYRKGFPIIPNANVVWNGDNGPIKLTYISDGDYVGNFYPRPGEKIKIEVSASGFDDVSCEITIPEKVYIDVDIKEYTSYVTQPYPTSPDINKIFFKIALSLKINDPISENNYYSIEGSYNIKLNDTDISMDIPLNSGLLASIGKNDREQDYFKQYKIFSDEIFESGKVVIDFSAESAYEGFKFTPEYYECKIRVYHYSEDYYKNTRTHFFNQYIDPMLDEPIVVHSNVENGAGNIGAYSYTDYNIKLYIEY